MPMYQPSSRGRGGCEVRGGGQVLDRETAVKDGVLGGVGGGVPSCATGAQLDGKELM